MLHPDPVQVKHISKLMNSGALFARKFVLGTSDEAWSNIEKILSQKVGGKALSYPSLVIPDENMPTIHV